jgi:uncharacterized phage protein gp47/JayE
VNGTESCGCCEGIATQTLAPVNNRPGLSQIAYRVGTWAQFKASMLDALSAQPSLAGLKTRSDDDFTIALLDAFAVVCDILAFYSERGANEHYLRTAADVVSLRELAKLVGYKPAPGVAASVPLAITVQAPPSLPPGSPAQPPTAQLVPPIVTVAAGLQVQNVPNPGDQPLTFETVGPIEARWGWNALQPRITRPLAADPSNATPSHLRLNGLIGSLSVGDWLLAVVNPAGPTPVPGINRIASVALDNATQTTVVTFEGGNQLKLAEGPTAAPPALSGMLGDAAIRAAIQGFLWSDQTQLVANAAKLQWPLLQLEQNINAFNAIPGNTAPAVQVFKLGVRAAVFGHNAPLYNSLPAYTAIGGGSISGVLANWDSPPATVGSDDANDPARLSLDQTYPALVAGGWVVVLPAPQTLPILFQTLSLSIQRSPLPIRTPPVFIQTPPLFMKITASRELSRTGFMLSAKVTQLELQADPTTVATLGSLPIRTTAILGSTDQYLVAEEPLSDPIGGTVITLATAQLGLTPGQQVVVTGAALDQSASKTSEVRTIAAVALVDGYTQITLDLDLGHEYDPASVTINANIAPATQGAAKSEILGSGDGTAAYQQFALKQPPLTYVSAATPSGVASTLQVRVNGIAWQEAPWLAGEGPTQPVYVTFTDEQGNTIVEFGDGAENGARLPSGQNNVTATYRQGIGSAGNVAAGQITTLLTRPLGVQSVINPVAASGGGDPETIDAARRNVPTTTRALDRIVALEDVGDFARASASIAKAEAVWAWDGRRHVACVTVAAPGGAAVDPTSTQYRHLISAMRAASDGTFPIVLCSYVPRSFALGATLTTDPSRDADAVVAAAKDALRAAFGFDARDFMQPVFQSEIFAVLQAVPGVTAATIEMFRFSDASAADPMVSPNPLPANPPVLFAGALVGAELLTLEPGLLPAVVHA